MGIRTTKLLVLHIRHFPKRKPKRNVWPNSLSDSKYDYCIHNCDPIIETTRFLNHSAPIRQRKHSLVLFQDGRASKMYKRAFKAISKQRTDDKPCTCSNVHDLWPCQFHSIYRSLFLSMLSVDHARARWAILPSISYSRHTLTLELDI